MSFRLKQKPVLNSEERKKLTQVFYKAKKEDFQNLKPEILKQLAGPEIPVIISCLNYIGRCQIQEMQHQVLQLLHHNTALVRGYALQAIYVLMGAEALKFVENAFRDENLGVQTTAHIVDYFIRRNAKSLDEIRELLDQDYDYYYLSTLVMNTFDSFIDIEDDSQVIQLLKDARDKASDDSEFYDEVSDLLKQVDG